MKVSFRIPVVIAALTGLSACGTIDEGSLVFASANTWGLTLSGSPAETGVGATLGYKSQDLAMIPAYAYGENGDPVRVQAEGTATIGKSAKDALSVFAQFASKTPTTAGGGTSASGIGASATTGSGSGSRLLAHRRASTKRRFAGSGRA